MPAKASGKVELVGKTELFGNPSDRLLAPRAERLGHDHLSAPIGMFRRPKFGRTKQINSRPQSFMIAATAENSKCRVAVTRIGAVHDLSAIQSWVPDELRLIAVI